MLAVKEEDGERQIRGHLQRNRTSTRPDTQRFPTSARETKVHARRRYLPTPTARCPCGRHRHRSRLSFCGLPRCHAPYLPRLLLLVVGVTRGSEPGAPQRQCLPADQSCSARERSQTKARMTWIKGEGREGGGEMVPLRGRIPLKTKMGEAGAGTLDKFPAHIHAQHPLIAWQPAANSAAGAACKRAKPSRYKRQALTLPR